MKKMKQALLLFLCFAALLTATFGLSACSKDEEEPSETVSTEETENESVDSEEVDLFADLPKGYYADEKGTPAEFNILNSYNDWALITMDSSTSTTSVDSAIFSRNSYLEETLGIDIKVITDYPWKTDKMIDAMVIGNDDTYDLVYNESWRMSTGVTNGTYLSVNRYRDQLNFAKPWWYSDLMNDLIISGNAYMIAGDMNMSVNDSIWCIAYNKTILNTCHETDPYETLVNKSWTFEELYRLTLSTSSDEVFGITSHSAFSTAMIAAAGLKFVDMGPDGTLKRTFNEELFTQVHQFITTNFYTQNGEGFTNCIRPHNESQAVNAGTFPTQQENFVTGRATFLAGTIGDMRSNLIGSDIDYGLLPMPKYSSTQDKYISYIYRNAMLGAIPSTAQGDRLERICVVLENLNAESYRTLVPAYYDIVLYGRVALYPESTEMLDVILGRDERGVKSIDLDAVLDLGMTKISELCASDLVANPVRSINEISGSVDAKIKDVHAYYALHRDN